jgi:hypothetical protein
MATIDVSELEGWKRLCAAAPERSADVLRRAVNDAGNAARTQVVRTLGRQMGLPYATVRQGLSIRPATSEPVYEINSVGGYLSLKSFDAEQRRGGVSARPWGQRRMFRGTFIVRSLGGQVFRRTTQARFPIVKLWGPAMPQEMVRGAVPGAFEAAVKQRLPVRLAHHLERLFPAQFGGAQT